MRGDRIAFALTIGGIMKPFIISILFMTLSLSPLSCSNKSETNKSETNKSDSKTNYEYKITCQCKNFANDIVSSGSSFSLAQAKLGAAAICSNLSELLQSEVELFLKYKDIKDITDIKDQKELVNLVKVQKKISSITLQALHNAHNQKVDDNALDTIYNCKSTSI